MIENVLEKRSAAFKTKIAVKTLISAAVVALAVILPQIVHALAGAAGGAKWLPMYLPVLIGGCLLGWKWGLAVGVLSPLASFAITSMFGDPMPAAARLPYMIVELAVFAGITGLFSRMFGRHSRRFYLPQSAEDWFSSPLPLCSKAFLLCRRLRRGRRFKADSSDSCCK